MSNFKLSKKSEDNMVGMHPDLIKVIRLALELSSYDFGVNSTSVRTMEEQKKLLASGVSKTLNSRHVKSNNSCNLSCAVDINVYNEEGKLTWEIGYFRKVAQAFVTAAITLGIQIELGCLWKSFVDGPHIQLSRKVYA